jgi:lysophospholipid acyltransferase (LPLAT)-like uncharacterized protein
MKRMAFNRWQRLQISLISFIGWAAIWLIGCTLRYRVDGWKTVEDFRRNGKPIVFSFWHNQIFYATHYWRFQNVVVITSQHFDGEYIARIIEKFGYLPARGSSTRGAVRALLELKRCLAKGHDVAFTIDGPRGPVYTVKPGPVWLAQKTLSPLLVFHMEPESFWKLRTWDGLRIPKPFSRVLLKIGTPIWVSADTEEEAWLGTFQARMDELRTYCENYWSTARAGKVASGSANT